MNLKNIFLFVFALTVLGACSSDPLDVSPSNKDLGIKFVHLDSIFVHSPAEKMIATVTSGGLKENEILAYELGHCLRVGQLQDSGTLGRIKLFVNDPFVKRVEKRIAEQFSTLDTQKEQIRNGFAYLNHHFPAGKVPKNIVFINSFFASNVFCTETEIGIGLERYLGNKTDVIKELPSQDIYQWIKDGMRKEYLERDVLTAWIMTHYVPEDKTNTAAAIVRWGKIIYLTEASFPKVEKNIVLRYSKKDYQWALDNESAFWKYLVDEKLLFSEDERDQNNFLNDAPFTIGLPEKGPDRLGQFLGWKMVHSYMEEHPETTLQQLIDLPYNTILQAYDVN